MILLFFLTIQYQNLWEISDFITNQVITSDRLMNKPIDLRHPYIFYLGHLPVFMDIQISKALNESPTDPLYYTEIFERGIDPIIDHPSQCHPHSEVPSKWPQADEILSYRDRVRERFRKILSIPASTRLARAIAMAFEHEAMHIEVTIEKE